MLIEISVFWNRGHSITLDLKSLLNVPTSPAVISYSAARVPTITATKLMADI